MPHIEWVTMITCYLAIRNALRVVSDGGDGPTVDTRLTDHSLTAFAVDATDPACVLLSAATAHGRPTRPRSPRATSIADATPGAGNGSTAAARRWVRVSFVPSEPAGSQQASVMRQLTRRCIRLPTRATRGTSR